MLRVLHEEEHVNGRVAGSGLGVRTIPLPTSGAGRGVNPARLLTLVHWVCVRTGSWTCPPRGKGLQG